MKKIIYVLIFSLFTTFGKVNSQGFSPSAVDWSLPTGGLINSSASKSFNSLANSGNGNTDGSQSWSTLDMNGDGILDLVVFTERQAGTHNVFNLSSSPYWKVYLGTSSGFSSNAVNWSLPSGGLILNSVNRSFNELNNSGNGNTDGSQSWEVGDFNGDGITDLLVLTERVGGTHNVFGSAGSRYWKLYVGTATGFSSTAINWTLPAGGLILSSVDRSFNALSNYGSGDTDGSQSWHTADFNGDGLFDLMVLTERVGGTHNVLGATGSRYWKYYVNTGTGFSTTSLNWNLPTGGRINNSTDFSFNEIYVLGYGNTDGSQAWSIVDLNGDDKSDLVVYSERQAGTYNVFNFSSSPFWKVYLNTGTGFSLSAINWALPAGGYINNSVSYSFNELFNAGNGNTNGSQAWSIFDVNGDSKLDLNVYAERQFGTHNVFNLSTNPSWKVYLSTGSGFSLSPINWSLPVGGLINNSVNYSFSELNNFGYGNTNGSQAWTIIDMNGDHQIDLLVYLERQAGAHNVFNLPNSPYWKLYLGNATTSSIESNASSNSNLYEVYPNPVSDVLTIKSNLNTNEKLKVSLTNILGQQEFEKEFLSNENLNNFQIQMNTYTKGFYFLTIQSNKTSDTFKIQIQ